MKKLLVKQVRSGIGRRPEVHATLSALGLGRIGKSQVHEAKPATLGMIKSVEYLLKVTDAPSSK